MGSLDPAKILVILLVALIVLGPERLPRAARQLGGMWRELTRLRDKVEQEVREAIPDLDLPPIPKVPKGGLTGYLTGMMASTTPGGASAGGARAGGMATTEADGPTEAGDYVATGWQSASDSGESWSGAAVGQAAAGSGLAGLPEGLPAGWQSVGAAAPGYASGWLLSPVPTGTASGPIGAEVNFTFDEPSWN